jgi:hypothetical protein
MDRFFIHDFFAFCKEYLLLETNVATKLIRKPTAERRLPAFQACSGFNVLCAANLKIRTTVKKAAL